MDDDLINALASRNASRFKDLLARGANVNARNDDGDTPLHYAAIIGNKRIAVALVAKGADISAKNANGDTPLHDAVRGGNKGIVEALIAAGGDVNAKGAYDLTPLHVAVHEGDQNIVTALLAMGADVNATTNNGILPLDIAALHRNKKIAAILVASSADVSMRKDTVVSSWLKEMKIVDDLSTPRDLSPQSATERLGCTPTGSFVIDVDMSSPKGVKER